MIVVLFGKTRLWKSMMTDSIWFINHALRVNQLSVYSNEQRFEQTLETLNSINDYCPNNKVFIFDSSPDFPDEKFVNELNYRGAFFYYSGDNPEVREYSRAGHRSVAESITFISFLEWFKKQDYTAKRIYKLSGRYRVNENFIRDDDSFKDSFVFAKALDSWMPEHRQNFTKVNKLFRLRFWHMDYNLLETFEKELKNILNDCMTFGIDVEHSYYKNLHTYKTIELDKIGVCGNIAPNGDYIDE